MDNSKGFTLIELIVVIAIIAILVTIALVNVFQYIGKGKDSVIQADLSGALTNGVMFFVSNSSYSGFCSSPEISTIQTAVTSTGGNFTCNVDNANDAWCACSTLIFNPGNVFCVDSTGNKKIASSADCDTECPATGVCL